ncbi:type II secretion system protein N [Hyphomonas oceanitis]|uniref:General secretion pathway protein C n=1 Tax=Hyphomonas oceanitis SCH89 TaxID=1280953 RepID=A0A059G4X4_9PROT|nr:type II secretion system protein N [Hyphomonas oceanitis]KDA01867.1 general secretion pathway protein C [Hyphomonas oceanitis SCH89]
MRRNPSLWAIWIAGGVGSVFVLHNLAGLTWHALGYVALPNSETTRNFTPLAAPQNRDTIAPLLAWAPFGHRVEAAGPSAVQATLDLKSLKLLAVRVAQGAAPSTATISVDGGPATIFQVGDLVSQGMRLEHVAQRGVVLGVGGRFAELGFASTSPSGGASIQTAGESAAQAPRQETITPAPAAAEIIDAYRQRVMSDPEGLVRQFSLEPSAQGYVVGSNPPAALLAAGLKPGDRVTRVNGASVGNISSDSRLFETVIASGRARVEIDRDGRAIILTFPLH